MTDYISREDFLADKRRLYCENCNRRKGTKNGKTKFVYEIGDAPCRSCGIGDVLDDVEEFPAADVAPVVHGGWERKPDPFGFFDTIPVCSACGNTTKWREEYPYCPCCGAKMDGKQEKCEAQKRDVDAVPVVRCRDCKHSQPWYADKSRCFLWHESGIDVFNDGYCSYGERKEDTQ